jgi:hypothetical protein
MSVSRESTEDDRQLIRYLCGLLSNEEAERLDGQSIVEDDVAARLRSVENDLVDAYVTGTLEGELLEPFESFYLASPRRREKVKFARRFLGAVDRASAAGPGASGTTPSPKEPLRFPSERTATHAPVVLRSRFVWSLAAAAMLFLTCGILFFQDARLRRGLGEAQREGADLDRRAQAMAGQLDEQRAANNAMLKELERVRAAQPIAPIALVLLPQTRGIGPVSVIALSPGSGVVAFDLKLEASDFTRYEIALKDPATNHIVWRSGTLTPGSSRRPATIAVAVPATVLKPQHYLLELSGRKATGAFDIVGSYAFQIQSR